MADARTPSPPAAKKVTPVSHKDAILNILGQLAEDHPPKPDAKTKVSMAYMSRQNLAQEVERVRQVRSRKGDFKRAIDGLLEDKLVCAATGHSKSVRLTAFAQRPQGTTAAEE